jgi:hypothetical protein
VTARQDQLKEFQLLQRRWMELFVEHDMADADVEMELHHMPPGIRLLIHDILEQIGDSIQEQISCSSSPEDGLNMMYTSLTSACTTLSARFYRLGAALKDELPYEKMTPCNCTSPSDEELADLLSRPFELEGEGWVIKGFETKKEGRP